MKHSPRFLALVENVRPKIQECSVKEVQARVLAGDKFMLIDVREDHEWRDGHLPGAIHLGRGILERDIEKLAPDPQTPLVLYCGGGFRSILAAESLQKMGYTNVSSMDGGFRCWKEAKLAIIP